MYSLDGNGIRNMIYGATIFGGGGGGACESGEMALDQFKEDHGIADDADVMVQVMAPEEMDDAGYACCTAAMGAPTKFKEVRIAPYINGSFDHLCKMADEKRKSIDYSIAVEIGGFNTLVPLLVAMERVFRSSTQTEPVALCRLWIRCSCTSMVCRPLRWPCPTTRATACPSNWRMPEMP